MALRATSSAAEVARAIPAPALAEPATQQMTSEVAIVASGCFWGVQGVFQHVEGVTSAISGYAGGTRDAAQYESVSTGTTAQLNEARVFPAGIATRIEPGREFYPAESDHQA